MHSQWYQWSPSSLPRGVAVIDATPGAEKLWETIVLSTLEELREQLAPELLPEIVFLGDRRSQAFGQVVSAIAGEAGASGSVLAFDYRQELGRYPVVGPYLREWLRSAPRPIVLLTQSPIEDLGDWARPEIVASLLIKRLTGLDRLTPPPFREIGMEAELDELVKHLQDPPRRFHLEAPGVFAIDWQPDELQWNQGTLAGAGSLVHMARLHLIQAEEKAVDIEVQRESGTTLRLPLSPIAPPPGADPIPLSIAEASVIERWVQGRSFPCAACPEPHPPGQLRCRSGHRTSIFPSLQPFSESVIWRVKRTRSWMALIERRGLTLHEERILANRDGQWASYELVDGLWVPGEPPALFVPVSQTEYLFPG